MEEQTFPGPEIRIQEIHETLNKTRKNFGVLLNSQPVFPVHSSRRPAI
jgi:hypothetical protein